MLPDTKRWWANSHNSEYGEISTKYTCNKGSKIKNRFDLFLNLLEIRFTTEKLFKQYDGLKIAKINQTELEYS